MGMKSTWLSLISLPSLLLLCGAIKNAYKNSPMALRSKVADLDINSSLEIGKGPRRPKVLSRELVAGYRSSSSEVSPFSLL